MHLSRPGSFFLGTLLLVTGCAGADAPTPAGEDPTTLVGDARFSQLPEAVETVSGAIMGGSTDDETSSVVGLVTFGGYGFGICSGSLIAPNVVLTAQHCIASLHNDVNGGVDCTRTTFGPSYPASSVFISTLVSLDQNPNSYSGVREVVVPPGSNGVCGNDVALLILDAPVGVHRAVPLTPRVDEQLVAATPWNPASGEEYSAVGYGNTSESGGGSGLRRRRDNLRVTCVGQDCPYYGVTNTEWIGDQGICQGDSGGPAIDLHDRVTGVVSRGGSGCSFPIYGSVYAWGAWIKETVQRASTEGGLTAPVWVNGWPTHPDFNHPIGAACGQGSDCPSGFCEGGVCTRWCNEQAPCAQPFHCHDSGICLLLPVGEACGADSDCDSLLCRDGICTRSCSDILACPTGFLCDAGSALCRAPAVGGACSAAAECEGGLCSDALCTRVCGANAPCPDGYACSGAWQCELLPVGGDCAADAECSGGVCLDGACTRGCGPQAPCPGGYVCDSVTGMCDLLPLEGACAAHSDCVSGICLDGFCSRECSAAVACDVGYECLADGLCGLAEVGGGCASDDECSGGMCVEGVCTRGCEEDVPCPSGFSCGATGACVPVVNSATGCEATEGRGPLSALALALVLLAWFGFRRRRLAAG